MGRSADVRAAPGLVKPKPFELAPLEVASGLVFGFTPPEPLPEPTADPVEALEAAILPALLRPPCVVSFSGGRDSSTILAIAVRVARREGLELPVPATNRFSGNNGADQTAWQERVVIHLGLTDWSRFEFTDELDPVGPVAKRALRRHGLLWPFNAHFHLPLIDEAAGGAVLTGIGGDESFGAPRWAPAAVRRTVPSRRDQALPWLRAEAQQEMWGLWTADMAAEPLRWQNRAAWCLRRRCIQLRLESLAVLAAEQRVEVISPFVDACFAATLAALPRKRRYLPRAAAMRELFSDLLPAEVLAHRTRAHVDDAFWRTHSRRHAAEWGAAGLDAAIVDLTALRAEWAKPNPDTRTFLLLQAAAVARERASAPHELAQAAGGLA